jgi:hypothetical protein
VHGGSLRLPTWSGSDRPAPVFADGAATSSEDPAASPGR